jgi:soluble epoxide hydrolase/lipid-phosphate phosphatase
MTITEHILTTPRHTTSYLTAGPEDGPLLVFVHGWPAIARTWEPQLECFAALGFRVVAPDMRGYGHSTVHESSDAYAQEHLVADMLELLDHLGREKAVWIGHDWGSPTVWGLASHHPDRCVAVASLVIPYRTIELGLEEALKHVNREIYPVETHPDAQFDYMAFYEKNPERITEVFEAEPANSVRTLFRSGTSANHGKPGPTSAVTRDGGWFGGADAAPDLPRDPVVLSEKMLEDLTESLTRNGFSGPTGYYLNHGANRRYTETSVNNGRIDVPVLYIEATYDAVADTSVSDLATPMRENVSDLTEHSVATGHWAAMERPAEVNAALAAWLVRKVPTHWPFAG